MFTKQWEFLKKKFESGQLAHAYLLSGPEEIKKENFAKEFIKQINCIPNLVKQKPCQECQNCKMIESGIFPDMLAVKSSQSQSSLKNEKDMMGISIEQIRDAQNFLSYKSYYGNIKSVVIENAETMNAQAQNCFLKSLEEPKGKTIIFLLTSKPDILLPTIFSRCQQVKFFYAGKYEISNDEQKVLDGLQKIIGNELAEKFKYAKSMNLEEGGLNKILNVLQKYFRKLLLMKIGVIKGQDVFLEKFSIEKLKKDIKLIEKISHQVAWANANKKLALEIVLMEL